MKKIRLFLVFALGIYSLFLKPVMAQLTQDLQVILPTNNSNFSVESRKDLIFQWTDIGAVKYEVIFSGPLVNNQTVEVDPLSLGGSPTGFSISNGAVASIPSGTIVQFQILATTQDGSLVLTPLTTLTIINNLPSQGVISSIFTTSNVKKGTAFFDFSLGNSVEGSSAWDVAFDTVSTTVGSGDQTRTVKVPVIRLNVPLGVQGAIVPGNFDSVIQAPGSGFATDAGMDPKDMVIGDKWYIYQPDHTLLPKSEVYVVRTVEGNYAKFQVLDYYNQQGESGYFTFRFLYQPDGSRNLKP